MTDFHVQARVAARKDPRHTPVLEQLRKADWPDGQPLIPAGECDRLATHIVAAIRRHEGLEQPITNHTYEGDGGTCTATYFSREPCGRPKAEHKFTEDEDDAP